MTFGEIAALVSIVSVIITAIVTVSTLYLRMFVSGKLASLESDLWDKLEQKYVPRETITERFAATAERINALQQQITDLRRECDKHSCETPTKRRTGS